MVELRIKTRCATCHIAAISIHINDKNRSLLLSQYSLQGKIKKVKWYQGTKIKNLLGEN
jgi:hypothetical protein